MELTRFLLVLVVALVAALAANTAPSEAEPLEEDHFFKKFFHKPNFDYPKPYPDHPFFKKLHKPHPFFKLPFPFLHGPPIKPPSDKVKPDVPKDGGRYDPGKPPAEKP